MTNTTIAKKLIGDVKQSGKPLITLHVLYAVVIILLFSATFFIALQQVSNLNTYSDFLLNDLKPSYESSGMLSEEQLATFSSFFTDFQQSSKAMLLVALVGFFLYALLRTLRISLIYVWNAKTKHKRHKKRLTLWSCVQNLGGYISLKWFSLYTLFYFFTALIGVLVLFLFFWTIQQPLLAVILLFLMFFIVQLLLFSIDMVFLYRSILKHLLSLVGILFITLLVLFVAWQLLLTLSALLFGWNAILFFFVILLGSIFLYALRWSIIYVFSTTMLRWNSST